MNEGIVLSQGRQEVLDASLGNMDKERIEGLARSYGKTQRAYIEDKLFRAHDASSLEAVKYWLGIAKVAYEDMVRWLGETLGKDESIERRISGLEASLNQTVKPEAVENAAS